MSMGYSDNTAVALRDAADAATGNGTFSVALDAHDRDRWASLDALPSPVAVVDAQGIVRWANAAWTHASRARWQRPTDAVGAHYVAACRQGMSFGREALEAIGDGLRAVLSRRRETFEYELASHPAGAEAWFNVTVTPCTVDGRRGAMVQHVDVTDLRQADRRRAVASAVARAMDREDTRRDMLRDVVGVVCELMGWTLAATWRWDHGAGVLRCEGVHPRSFTNTRGWSAVTTASGIAARVWGDHEPRWFDEIDREDAAVMRTALGQHADAVREAVGIPAGREGNVDGVVVFYSPHAHRPDAAMLRMLAMLFTGARWSPASLGEGRPAPGAERADERDAPRSTTTLAAMSVAPLLLRGERGVGKSRLAREIHARSDRSRAPFVECNCAALKASSVDDELFGHEAGAVPGSSRSRRGLFEEAAGGTLVLRDIGALDAGAQLRVLKALDARAFRRIGGAREIKLEARVIATTSRDLHAAVAEGAFHEDLLRHLSALVVEVPALRDRDAELDDIARRALDDIARAYNRPAPAIAAEALRALHTYGWPGNVRELRNVLERAWLGVGNEVSSAAVVAAIASLVAKAANDTTARGRSEQPAASAPAPRPAPAPKAPQAVVIPAALLADASLDALDPSRMTLASFERAHIERVLVHTGYNMRRAAQILGISRSTLYLRAKEYKLDLEGARKQGRDDDEDEG